MKELVRIAVPESADAAPHEPRLGDWYWVTEVEPWDDKESGRKKGDRYEWLGCVMHIGSNFVKLEGPRGYNGRVHFDHVADELRYEPEATAVIRGRIESYQAEARRIVGEIQAIARRLGVQQIALPEGEPSGGESRALAVMAQAPDIKGYEKALIKARDKELPELFDALKKNNEIMARWMTAETLPLKAGIGPLQSMIGTIGDRIFNVSLYAGLAEQCEKVADGAAAGMGEPLHVMQRRLYMDEECLLDYRAGGMEFKNIGQFDKWLARPKNRDRVLPFPRTLLAMQVRRGAKERHGTSLISAFVNLQLADADKLTFLYIRNGEQLWRLNCELEFSTLIFPDRAMFDPATPKLAVMSGDHPREIISRGEYEARLAANEEKRRLWQEWKDQHPGDKGDGFHNPHGWHSPHYPYIEQQYQPFDTSSVYYDEIASVIDDQIKKYNRIALLIQGLFDRSEVLHPHPPVQTWKPEGFARAVRLVYDASGVLHYGEAPDFEAYRERLNATLGMGSVVTGQEEVWLRREAERENARLNAAGRGRDFATYQHYRPHGDPGPGLVATIAEWRKRGRQAIFRWERERRDWRRNYYYGRAKGEGPLPCSVAVPAAELLNISAYQKGDYLQFYRDPRTRQRYLQWAPLLLTAEDYLAGKVKKAKGES